MDISKYNDNPFTADGSVMRCNWDNCTYAFTLPDQAKQAEEHVNDHLKYQDQAVNKETKTFTDMDKRKALEEFMNEHEVKTSLAKESSTRNIIDIIKESNEVKEIYIPELDCNVKYKDLSLKQIIEISDIKNLQAQTAKHVYYILHNADSSITEDDLLNTEGFGFKADAILGRISIERTFLPEKTLSKISRIVKMQEES